MNSKEDNSARKGLKGFLPKSLANLNHSKRTIVVAFTHISINAEELITHFCMRSHNRKS